MKTTDWTLSGTYRLTDYAHFGSRQKSKSVSIFVHAPRDSWCCPLDPDFLLDCGIDLESPGTIHLDSLDTPPALGCVFNLDFGIPLG